MMYFDDSLKQKIVILFIQLLDSDWLLDENMAKFDSVEFTYDQEPLYLCIDLKISETNIVPRVICLDDPLKQKIVSSFLKLLDSDWLLDGENTEYDCIKFAYDHEAFDFEINLEILEEDEYMGK